MNSKNLKVVRSTEVTQYLYFQFIGQDRCYVNVGFNNKTCQIKQTLKKILLCLLISAVNMAQDNQRYLAIIIHPYSASFLHGVHVTLTLLHYAMYRKLV